MKRFINTIRNIWKIEELRQRIVLTLLLILVYRLGTYVVLPGVDAGVLAVSLVFFMPPDAAAKVM